MTAKQMMIFYARLVALGVLLAQAILWWIDVTSPPPEPTLEDELRLLCEQRHT
jgi:hypothetical protein